MSEISLVAYELAAIIASATFLAFLAAKTKQPTVIAYIAAGVLIGPALLDLVHSSELTKFLSELGLGFLLFLIGLEIDIDDIRGLFQPITIIAGSQMLLTAMAGFLIGTALGFTQPESLVLAAAAMFSSTAVVVKLLTDKDEGSSLPEKLDIGILLIQDVAVVILLALMAADLSSPGAIAFSLFEVAAMIGVIGFITLSSSKYLLPRLFREISDDKHGFFIHGVAWAFLMIWMANTLGISMEIGAFFAGLSIAQLPYSRELMEQVRPLTDLFMAIFFINFGLGINPAEFLVYWKEALIATAAIMTAKMGIIFTLTDRQKFTPETSFITALNMTQISEFGLILGALAVGKGIIGAEFLGFIGLVTIASMGISSYLITYNSQIHRKIEHLLERFESEDKNDVEISELEDHAVVIGYDHMARAVIPVLSEYYDRILVIDRNTDNARELANSDYEYIYGDFRHGEIRKAANLEHADFVLSVAPTLELNRDVVEFSGPDTTVFTKSSHINEAAELYELGSHYVIIKNILTGDKLGEYIKLFLEDEELFEEETKIDKDRIKYGGRDL